jgi:signal transduction histidine kinase
MSHELRTPLNAIIGYSELLAEECEEVGDEGYLPDLARINTAAKHQLTLINDILDLSKIEAGRMTIFPEDFDTATLLDGVKSMVAPLIEKNGNILVIECPVDAGGMHSDVTKVRQALFNLLSNAAKFTEHGTITLAVTHVLSPQPSVLSPLHCHGHGHWDDAGGDRPPLRSLFASGGVDF